MINIFGSYTSNGQTCNNYTYNQLDQMLDQIYFVCIDWSVLNKNFVDYLKEKNKIVFSCTCDNMFTYNYMKKFNLDGIVTNIII